MIPLENDPKTGLADSMICTIAILQPADDQSPGSSELFVKNGH
jgi:hypothetical protein